MRHLDPFASVIYINTLSIYSMIEQCMNAKLRLFELVKSGSVDTFGGMF